MNYGFVIDNRKCIGCHACSTACKSENEVPLGVYRTWVKYVETGTFPNTRRHFQVTRCNHCANPPCARICPVTAMYQRDDGIVDFDPSICIGCKACMQACPYDAIYIDPESNTAAKCHYCAHRTEIGLEPACVVVCPEHAIISGDMDDPGAEIGQLLASQQVTVRKPEQGTSPKLFYIEGNEVALHPTAVERTPTTFMWADVIPLHGGQAGGNGHGPASNNGRGEQSPERATAGTSNSGATLRAPQPQGAPSAGPISIGGPIMIGGTVAEHMVQVAYNAQHKIPWHWPVPGYLVTKAIGAGIFMLLSLGLGLQWFAFDDLTVTIAGFLTLLFVGLTTVLLVYDLDKPERFFSILYRPQWRSWLARGAFILVSFSAVAGIWWLLEAGAYVNIWSEDVPAAVRPIALWLGLPLAVGAAVYTAYLFSQAEGRDLWQSPLLPIHLLIQSFVAGSGALLIVALFLPDAPEALTDVLWIAFSVALILDLFVILVGEFTIPHASEVAARAAHEISHGHYKNLFWWGSIAVGHVLPLALALATIWLTEQPILGAIAGLAAIAGLYAYEYAFVMAPQEIPNS